MPTDSSPATTSAAMKLPLPSPRNCLKPIGEPATAMSRWPSPSKSSASKFLAPLQVGTSIAASNWRVLPRLRNTTSLPENGSALAMSGAESPLRSAAMIPRKVAAPPERITRSPKPPSPPPKSTLTLPSALLAARSASPSPSKSAVTTPFGPSGLTLDSILGSPSGTRDELICRLSNSCAGAACEHSRRRPAIGAKRGRGDLIYGNP